ncbi:putative PIG3 family NAD(P)H quinone oxidoreductase [Allocatelliglobosispora scoriae]|uniref:Putative PIG3 family NAD(P)H quinone oxidoreductase n=1 Tax=Allocatelliglobosispora scoriae TaxID=643052 RepID=A0A841BW41_9ACTN|nr:NAD(P)H-quinone oxidoreductase [Allocatelliglobosispora scoriae]MBB5871143.1 putative PIG3 family NAD(P)H quinone oxidoreductase [Allocatelliglobosispora scoriae]
MTNPTPGSLIWEEVPDAAPAPGEVLIDVAAAGINRADLLQVAGKYPPPKGASPYPGMECSGVVATGSGRWRVGEEVCALLPGGGYATSTAVDAEHVLPIPKGVSLIDAAGLPEVACTVWSNLTMVAGLRAGETILIHGGGSGIGTFAIQYAKALGARVLTTARSEKHAALKALGADVTLDYRTDDFTGVGADVVLDIMGAAYLAKNLAALAGNGRLVVIGMQGGRSAELDLGTLLAKRASVFGTTLRSRPSAEKSAIVAGVERDVWPLIEAGAIRPVIDRTMPMTEAKAAQEVVASSDHLGKVLLTSSWGAGGSARG